MMRIVFGKSHKFTAKGTVFEIGLALFGVYMFRVIVKVAERCLAICLFGFVMMIQFRVKKKTK